MKYLFKFRLLLLLFVCSAIYFFSSLIQLNILPPLYLVVLLNLFVVYFCIIMLIFKKIKKHKKGFKRCVKVFVILNCIASVLIGNMFVEAKEALELISEEDLVTTTTISIITMNDDSMTEIADLENTNIGYYGSILNNDYTDIDQYIIDQVGFYHNESYIDMDLLFEELYTNELGAVVINQVFYNLMIEEDDYAKENTKVIFSYVIEEDAISIANEGLDTTSEPFTIFITCADAYGVFEEATGSDVNILVTINPLTNEIMMNNIPRDTYTSFPSYYGKDKLTHAGALGIDELVGAVELLFDIEVDFYAKFNFTSFIKIIDAIGGLSIHSDFAFTANNGTEIVEGINELDGKGMLGFVRERYAFEDGDVQRGKNQMAVIEALVKKITSPSILIHYSDIMNVISSSFQTNLSSTQISSLVQQQLKTMRGWSFIDGDSVDGYDAMGEEYPSLLMPSYVLYMYIPYQDSLDTIHDQIIALKNKVSNEKVVEFIGPLQLQ